jgi:excisionase family DNA binding protein
MQTKVRKPASEWINSAEMAEILGISQTAAVRWLNEERRIPHYKFGKMVRIRRADLEAFMEAHRVEAREPEAAVS